MAKKAEEKKQDQKQVKKQAKNAKPGFFKRVSRAIVNFFKKVGRFFLNMAHELKKVTWPTKKEMINYSLVVFVFMIIMTIIIGVFDLAASALVNLIVNI